MALDIRTLVFVVGILHVIQLVVFTHQYLINRTIRGVGWWLLWSGTEVLAFTFMLLRGIPAFQSKSIILQNCFLILGVLFLYIGIMRFFGRKENRWLLGSLYGVFLAGLCYFLYANENYIARGVVVCTTLAIVAFLSGQALLVNKTRSTASSANFLATVFIVHGCLFVYRTAVLLTGAPMGNFFEPTILNQVAFLDGIVVSSLWTFGTIMMINQRLNVEMKDAKEEMELIFNTSPDAAVISRLSDGTIVSINDGFVALSGFGRDECIGRTTLAVNIWKNLVDRETLIGELREKGCCRNFETVFQRKDGSELSALLSAVTFNLQDIPHVITVSRDITERKQAQEALARYSTELEKSNKDLQEAVAKVKTLSGMLPICASCKKIRDDTGYWNQIESYISQHSEVLFTHGFCPECYDRAMQEVNEFVQKSDDRQAP